MKKSLIAGLFLSACAIAGAESQSSPATPDTQATADVTSSASTTKVPNIAYTDLQSGPAGAIVTAYGTNLGSSVTVNGLAAKVVSASTVKVSFVMPTLANGAVSIQNGASNKMPFTVRAGHIYYVAVGGSDNNSGTSSAPFATIPHGFDQAKCGDVVYAMNGVSATQTDDYDAALAVEQKCSATNPIALVGYPGATVTVGNTNGPEYGIRNPDIDNDNFNGIVLAHLTIRGNNEGISVVGSSYWRIVGNDIEVPQGSGESGVVLVETSQQIAFLGNYLHDSGAGGTKYYHSFYATTDSDNIEVGWNTIANNKSCRGVQFYSTSGSPQYNLSVHDNVIHGQECDAINFSTIDATRGKITAYNNLVYHVGLGGTNDGLPNYACIASLGYGNSGGSMTIYGNTLADCGPAHGSTAGAFTVQSGSPTAILEDNLVLQNPGEVLYSPDSDTGLIKASDNYVSTKGAAGIVNSSYQLISGSPAIGYGAGISGLMVDMYGQPRPQSGKMDVGSLLSTSTSSAPASGGPSGGIAQVDFPLPSSITGTLADLAPSRSTLALAHLPQLTKEAGF